MLKRYKSVGECTLPNTDNIHLASVAYTPSGYTAFLFILAGYQHKVKLFKKE